MSFLRMFYYYVCWVELFILFISLVVIIGLSPIISCKVDYLIGKIKATEIIILPEVYKYVTVIDSYKCDDCTKHMCCTVER